MKKLRIGILTLPQETNYGGVLQAFAMQHTLRKLGYDAFTIDRHNRREYPSFWIHILGFAKRIFQHYVKHQDVSVKWNPFLSDSDFEKSMSDIRTFINRNMQMTRPVYSDQLEQIDNEYKFDAYVVGSDQVWLDGYCPNSFLDFVKRNEVIRVTYAASCSSKSFFRDKAKTSQCAELAQKFSGISVREKQLVEKCAKNLGITPLWVIDPTMLLTPQDYLEASNCNDVGISSVFTYILDDNTDKDEIVKTISGQIGLPVVVGNSKEEIDGTKVPVSIDKWLNKMYHSSFVVTDSFHGTVFSILFNKPFVSIVNKDRGEERFVSLLEMFGLKDRMIYEFNAEEVKAKVKSTINFSEVNTILDEERIKALSFLKDRLRFE